MKNMNMEDIILSILGNSTTALSEKQILDTIDRNGLEGISGMVILPSGEGFLLSDDEQIKKEEI